LLADSNLGNIPSDHCQRQVVE